MKDCIAILAAAGSSQRFAAKTSKIFAPVAGRTVLERTVRTIASVPAISTIVLALREADIPQARGIVEPIVEREGKQLVIIQGGDTRQQTVRLALEWAQKIAPQGLALVHDVARCLVSVALLEKAIHGATEWAAVTVGTPSSDSVKIIDAMGNIISSLKRSTVVRVQTPQVFDIALLRKAHDFADANEEYTDDASLVEKIHPVRIVTGERTNIKITHPEDLKIAELLLPQIIHHEANQHLRSSIEKQAEISLKAD